MRFLNWNRSYYAWINFAGTTLFIVTAITFVNQATAQEVFSYGSEGCIVRAIQRELGLTPTGFYDRITSQRVAELQREEGLPVDGIADIGVLQALLRIDPNNEEVLCLEEAIITGRIRTQVTANESDGYNAGIGGTGFFTVIATPNLLLRSAPSLDSAVIGSYSYGDIISLTTKRVYADGYTWAQVPKGGWIAADYLSYLSIGGADAAVYSVTGSAFEILTPYVVIIPISSGVTLSQVSQYVNNAFLEDSKLGKFINVGAYTSYSAAKRTSMRLRRLGLDARVVYHP